MKPGNLVKRIQELEEKVEMLENLLKLLEDRKQLPWTPAPIPVPSPLPPCCPPQLPYPGRDVIWCRAQG
jgi:hypothetical protein